MFLRLILRGVEQIQHGFRLPMNHFRMSFSPTPPSGWVQCISMSRNRQAGTNDAGHRTREVQPFAPRSTLQAHEECNRVLSSIFFSF